MLWKDSYIHHLKKASSVTYNAPHSHRQYPMKDLNGEEGIGQTSYRGFIRLATETGARAKSLVSLYGGRL